MKFNVFKGENKGFSENSSLLQSEHYRLLTVKRRKGWDKAIENIYPLAISRISDFFSTVNPLYSSLPDSSAC